MSSTLSLVFPLFHWFPDFINHQPLIASNGYWNKSLSNMKGTADKPPNFCRIWLLFLFHLYSFALWFSFWCMINFVSSLRHCIGNNWFWCSDSKPQICEVFPLALLMRTEKKSRYIFHLTGWEVIQCADNSYVTIFHCLEKWENPIERGFIGEPNTLVHWCLYW